MADAPSLRFDPRTGRYHDARGRFVATKRVSDEVDRYLAAVGRETDRLAGDYRAGRISLEEWRFQMRDHIKATHLNMARVAKGGRARMTDADNGRVGQIVRQQYGFLERWVEQIKGGWVLDGRLEARARQYVDAAGGTFERVQQAEMIDRGMDQERNVLDPDADHCRPDPKHGTQGCPELTALDWVPIGTLPLPKAKERTCFVNCKCFLEYRTAAQARAA